MNRYQKRIVTNIVIVFTLTGLAVFGMIVLKDYINRSEAILAMENINETIAQYRQQNGAVPPESVVLKISREVPGSPRLGGFHYRARWLDFNPDPNAILAYTYKKYNNPFIESGYVVIRYDGQVEWMAETPFEELLASQQSPLEKQITQQ